MKILVIGTGVIGTIYGWALQTAGHQVTHLVRTHKVEFEEKGAQIDILDERKGYQKYNQTTYEIHVISSMENTIGFDLVLVPVNSFQVKSVLEEIVPKCPGSFFYILTSNWNGTGIYDQILSRQQYVLGYPDGGGTVKNGIYWTNIGPEIHISSPTPENEIGFRMIQDVFSQADIKLDVQENMLHWLWVHNAGATAISVAFQKHRNTAEFLMDRKLLKLSFLATRECLDLCKVRGAGSNQYPEIAAFRWPMWLLIPMFKYNFRHNESMKRYTAHGESMPVDDIAANYHDILETGRTYDLDMPCFRELGMILPKS